MKTTNTILAAHDFSPSSKNALNIAAEIALKTDSKLLVYHVVSTSVLADTVSTVNYSPDDEIKKNEGLLKRSVTALKKKFPELKATGLVEFGFLIPTIADKIEDVKPWLMVLGVKKRSGFDKVIFGDVCSTLVDKISTPLLVVPLNVKVMNLNTVAYAWDGKTSETAQLNPLKTLLGNTLSDIVSVNISHYDADVEKRANTFNAAVKKMFPQQQVDLKQILGLDKETTMESALDKMKPDLLVVFSHHYGFWKGLFHKSFAKQAVNFSKSPVLVVY
jgi:nucleotide-binding universal stress UspA family protein